MNLLNIGPDHLGLIYELLHLKRHNPPGLICELIFSMLISHEVDFPNEVIGFRELVLPLTVCGKSGPWSCTSPQMKRQTVLMEISKAFLLEEKNKKKPSAETLQTVLI